MKRAPHILHLSAGCWADGGGLSEAMASLAVAQAKSGLQITVACLSGHPLHPLLTDNPPETLTIRTFRPMPPAALYLSPTLPFALPRLMRTVTHVHLHGGWSQPVFAAARAAGRLSLPLQWSLHGALGEALFTRHAALRRWVWRRTFRPLLCRATRLHACSAAEADRTRRLLGADCPPIVTVPDGVTLPPDPAPPLPRRRTFLFLGRLHPLKGLDLLEAAWNASGLAAQGWTLEIAGPPDGAPVPQGGGIIYLGLLGPEAKARALRTAACLVLPSRGENFGIAVAEALCCRTPVICTEGVPWPELGDFRVAPTAEALRDALCRMAALTSNAREARFAPLFDGAEARFDWSRIAVRLAPSPSF